MERSALLHRLYDHASEPGNPVASYQGIRESLQMIRLSLRANPFVTDRSRARSAHLAPFVTDRSQARYQARAARTVTSSPNVTPRSRARSRSRRTAAPRS